MSNPTVVMMNNFTPLDKIRCGYFGAEHKVKEKGSRGRFRIAKLVLCDGRIDSCQILEEYKTIVVSLDKHQNILNVKDAFLHKQHGFTYLCSVGKFLDPETLNSFLLSRNSALGSEAHKALLLQLVDAVSHLHSHGIAHNALTPYSARIVESNGNALIKLTDFGFAQIRGKPDHDNYNLDHWRARSLMFHLPPESNEQDWCDAFGKANTAADVFMLGLMFNAIAEHSILPQNVCANSEGQKKSKEILASFLRFPGYGAVPIGKFMHENPSVDLDHQLFCRLSPQFRRLIRRMVFLEPDGRPPISGVLRMLEPIDILLRQTPRVTTPDPTVFSNASESLDPWDYSDEETPKPDSTKPKKVRRQQIPFNPSIDPVQKRFTGSVLTELQEKPFERATGFVRRASMRVKKTSDRLRKRGSAKISG